MCLFFTYFVRYFNAKNVISRHAFQVENLQHIVVELICIRSD